ncbi:MAG: hypothetical protein ISS28_05240 [Candidatus Cloacimonetes bacterium]|nr:hypothetical protein [Candidatus Cloacimonadota bacterium]
MHSHPAVAEAALIGIPHDQWGEVGCAFVALENGQLLSAEELIGFLSDKLAKYKIPKEVRFINELPKTAIGKIDKKQLKPRSQ